MKAHIRSNNDKELTEKVEKKLREIYQKGLATGANAVSSVIYNKLCEQTKTVTDESGETVTVEKTDAEKIAEVIEFCKVSLGKQEEVQPVE